MAEGVSMSLHVGPAVPVPATRDVVDALESVQVTAAAGEATTFELAFKLEKNSPLLTAFMLAGGVSVPLVRVVVAVRVRGTDHVLVDGVMTDHEVAPGADGGASTLTIHGQDLTTAMTYLPSDGTPYPGLPVEGRVALILAKYAVLGVIPVVVPRILTDFQPPTEFIPSHRGTDLQYLRQLAHEAGYVFHLEPGPAVGTSTAYWGPLVKWGVPQKALTVDMDAHTNVESLRFRYESEKAVLPLVHIQEPTSKAPLTIPIPDVGLANPPLGLVPGLTTKTRLVRGTSGRSAIAAALLGLGEAARSSECVTGNGRLDVERYGDVLMPRRLVGVRGAGDPFDGLHYVQSVTHRIERGRFTQDFVLSRNGLLSTVPEVPT